MRYLWFLVFLVWGGQVGAQTMTVTNVKVSVTDSSPATAREKALDQAHQLAFQKLVEENFPESAGLLPPSDALMSMVTDFSIDREKTSPKSYTASLTFQFDGPQVHAWLHQAPLSSATPSSSQEPQGEPLKIVGSDPAFPEWHHIKKTLETQPGVVKIEALSLSPQEAILEVLYGGGVEKLQQTLLQQGLALSSQAGEWHLSLITIVTMRL